MFSLPKNISQKGIASFALIALLLIGISTGVYLIQTRTNFLPQAATIIYECNNCAGSGNKDLCRSAFSHCDYADVDSSQTLKGDDFDRCLSYATKKMWCQGPVNSPLSQTLLASPLEVDGVRTLSAADLNDNRVIVNELVSNNTPGCNCNSSSRCKRMTYRNQVSFSCINADTGRANDKETIRKIGSQYCNDLCSGSSCIVSFYSPEVTLKSGAKQSTDNRFYYHFACSTSLTTVNPELATAEQPANQPAAQPPASATNPGVVGDCPANRQLTCPAGESCKVDHVNTRWCTANKPDGESCGAGCIYIGGLKRVIYPENTPENGCNSVDKPLCTDANNEECAIFTKKINNKDYKYSACRKKTGTPAQPPAAGTQPRAAAPAGGAGAPAAAPASQPQSSTCAQVQDPWDIDKRGNSAKVEYVLKKASEASGAEATSQSIPINAATAAKSAYIRAFNTAYISSQGFGVDIGKAKNNGRCPDNSATLLRDKEANNTAIHAYVLKKSPGIDWNKAKSDGLVQEAIRELNLAGISVNDVSIPGNQPTRRVIDPSTAVDCGSDLDGTPIPCYKMGVFANYDDLKATEAEAVIATKRYEKSQAILNEVKDKVNAEILAAAQAKLDAAKAKAAACMPK